MAVFFAGLSIPAPRGQHEGRYHPGDGERSQRAQEQTPTLRPMRERGGRRRARCEHERRRTQGWSWTCSRRRGRDGGRCPCGVNWRGCQGLRRHRRDERRARAEQPAAQVEEYILVRSHRPATRGLRARSARKAAQIRQPRLDTPIEVDRDLLFASRQSRRWNRIDAEDRAIDEPFGVTRRARTVCGSRRGGGRARLTRRRRKGLTGFGRRWWKRGRRRRGHDLLSGRRGAALDVSGIQRRGLDAWREDHLQVPQRDHFRRFGRRRLRGIEQRDGLRQCS
ncbi:uncharacterized protein CMC5_021650 [Chondromyces crocatus]|uniref:Uncharacterized protein n=1 Tax=Chondromyces crocatus TaxID=52 RepID=A0A0K1EAZ5_CHOCO|nr:uncharacterized protein CMC5_021650 [Chondromyces crocatus]